MTNRLPITQSLSFHRNLNPAVWKDDELLQPVRLKLLQVSMLFCNFLGIDNLPLKDIVLVGSNAGYNYTSKSDIDIHLLVDFAKMPDSEMAENLFTTKKFLWSDYYNFKIKHFSIELYVEDTSVPVKSNGIFSIFNDIWIKFPSHDNPAYDKTAISAKANTYFKKAEAVIENPTIEKINDIFSKIHGLRDRGLEKGGEYSVENLVYKILRNSDIFDKLQKAKTILIQNKYSLS